MNRNNRPFWVLLFCLAFHMNAIYASEVSIIFKGLIPPNTKLKVYYYENLEEKAPVIEEPIGDKKEIKLQLDVNLDKYFVFSLGNTSLEALINHQAQNRIVYDFDKNEWLELINSRNHNDYLLESFAKFRQYKNQNVGDSATYVNYHLDFMEQMNLYPKNPNMVFNDAQIYLRKSCFSTFCNTLKGNNLISRTQRFDSELNKNILHWIDLENIKLTNPGYHDFLAIRNFHLYFAYEIFSFDSGRPTFYEFINQAQEWLQKTNYSSEVKTYILGDIIQFYSKIQFEFDKKSIAFLKTFLVENSQSRHKEFIKREIIKREKTMVFDLQVVDTQNQPLNLSNIEEKIIFVDFWATWCKPCLEENVYLEKLEEHFSGKVYFLKISIDDDAEKWMASHSKLRIDPGNSFILLQKDKVRATKDYSLESIPKFFILDNQGNIITASPHRPSNPELANQLLVLLNKY